MPEQTTIDDVVRHVEATEGWYLAYGTNLRRRLDGGSRCGCPISSLDGLGASDWLVVVRRRGLDYHEACEVLDAADMYGLDLLGGYELRRRLLAAAKLTEANDDER